MENFMWELGSLKKDLNENSGTENIMMEIKNVINDFDSI